MRERGVLRDLAQAGAREAELAKRLQCGLRKLDAPGVELLVAQRLGRYRHALGRSCRMPRHPVPFLGLFPEHLYTARTAAHSIPSHHHP